MAEKRAYARLLKMYPGAHWQRFESWSGVGVFDSNACLRGQEVWIEFKEVKPPKVLREDWLVKPTIRKSQVAWEALRRHRGGRTLLAIMIGDEMVILKGYHLSRLKTGMTYKEVKEQQIDVRTIFDGHLRSTI